MAKKKSLLEKAADAVDHVLHPHAEEEKAESEPMVDDETSSEKQSDYQKHPKFSKFNSSQGAE